ncbi:hypothetical protein C8R43DRAFT_531718 [Mycena crocata]|nr:hypothetical protein C8R43DRAFT_531718 [Mycena crocata]
MVWLPARLAVAVGHWLARVDPVSVLTRFINGSINGPVTGRYHARIKYFYMRLRSSSIPSRFRRPYAAISRTKYLSDWK